MLNASLGTALKEWNVVCQAMESGRQMILLRKGGIVEAIGGFELEHRQFLLFPTFLHQNREMLKAEFRAGVEPQVEEPATIHMSAAGEVTDILRVADRPQMDRLFDQHIWESPLIDMRFNYRPKNPLYLLIVRAYTLAKPVTIANTPAYAGCKSWVPLAESIATGGAVPVIDDVAFAERRAAINEALNAD